MKVRGQLKSIWPDRTQYKPYAYNLEMQNVFIDVDVPDGSVRKEKIYPKDTPNDEVEVTILDMDGFTCLLGSIADAIDEMHLASLKTKNTRVY